MGWWQAGLAERLRCRSNHRGKALLKAEPQVSRSCCGFAKDFAGDGAQPCPAACTAAIDAKQEEIGCHRLSSFGASSRHRR